MKPLERAGRKRIELPKELRAPQPSAGPSPSPLVHPELPEIEVPKIDAGPKGPQRAPKVKGCTIVANGAGAVAVAEAARILNAMIYDDELVKYCEKENVHLHIAPKGTKLTDLEDFADLRGKKCITGDLYDDCRGVHRPVPVNGRHVLVVKEEELIRSAADKSTDNVGLHEVAHLVHHYGEETNKPWAAELSRVFARAQNFTTEYSKKNRWEYFAEHSESAWGCAGSYRQANIKDVYQAERGLFAVMCEVYFGISDQMSSSAKERGQTLPLAHFGKLFTSDRSEWMSASSAGRVLTELGFERKAGNDPLTETYEWRPEKGRVSQTVVIEKFAIASNVADRIQLVTSTPDREQTLSLDYAGNFTRTAVTKPGAGKKAETLGDQLGQKRLRIEPKEDGTVEAELKRALLGSSLDPELMAGIGPHLLAPEILAALAEANVPLDSVLMSVGQIEKMNPDGGFKLAESLARHGYTHLQGSIHSDRAVLVKPLSADKKTYLRVSYEGYGEPRLYSMAVLGEIVTPKGSQKWIDATRAYSIPPPAPPPFHTLNPLLDAHPEIREWIAASTGPVPELVPEKIRALLADPLRMSAKWMDARSVINALRELGFKAGARQWDAPVLELAGEGWSAKVKLQAPRNHEDPRIGRMTLEVKAGDVTEVRRIEGAGEVDAFSVRGDPAKIPMLEHAVAGLYGQDDTYRRAMLDEALRQKLVIEARVGPGRGGIIESVSDAGVKLVGWKELVPIAQLESLRLRGGIVDAEALRQAVAAAGAKRDVFAPLKAALEAGGDLEELRAVAAGEPIDLAHEKGRALLLEQAPQISGEAMSALLEVAPGFELDTPLDAKGTTMLHAVLLAGDRSRGAYEQEQLLFSLLQSGASAGATVEVEGEKMDALAIAVLKAASSWVMTRTDALAEMIDRGGKLDAVVQGKKVWEHILDAKNNFATDFFRSVMSKRAKLDPQLRKEIAAAAAAKKMDVVKTFVER